MTSGELAEALGVSRQSVHVLMGKLVKAGLVVRGGSPRRAVFGLRGEGGVVVRLRKRLRNEGLREWDVLQGLREGSLVGGLTDEVRSIFEYGFSEMLNNAIEHSGSGYVEVVLERGGGVFEFRVEDTGVGVFRKVMRERGLKSEVEAMQDLLKGKVTTAPRMHSGEGIFFTSKVADFFVLESFGRRLVVDNVGGDVRFERVGGRRRGTKVLFRIGEGVKRSLREVFGEFVSEEGAMDFGRTEVLVRLFVHGTVHVSRSQARRIVVGLEKFRRVVLDFAGVDSVGQAFADEIFRVWQGGHPEVVIEVRNASEEVRFMVERVRGGE